MSTAQLGDARIRGEFVKPPHLQAGLRTFTQFRSLAAAGTEVSQGHQAIARIAASPDLARPPDNTEAVGWSGGVEFSIRPG